MKSDQQRSHKAITATSTEASVLSDPFFGAFGAEVVVVIAIFMGAAILVNARAILSAISAYGG